jgi:hypothetical protein
MASEISVGWCIALHSAIWEILLRSLHSWAPVAAMSQWKSGTALMSWWNFFLTCLILNRKAFRIKRLQIVWKLEVQVLAEPTPTDPKDLLPDGERTGLLALPPVWGSGSCLPAFSFPKVNVSHTASTGFTPLWVQLCQEHHCGRWQLSRM